MDTAKFNILGYVPTGQIIHQQSPSQALRFSRGFAKRRAQNVSDWWRSARDRVQILTKERRLDTRGRYISLASLVHFLRHWHTDLTVKKLRKLRRQRLQIFFPRPRVGTDIRVIHIAGYSVYIRRCHNCFLYFWHFNYLYFHQFVLIIYLSYISIL